VLSIARTRPQLPNNTRLEHGDLGRFYNTQLDLFSCVFANRTRNCLSSSSMLLLVVQHHESCSKPCFVLNVHISWGRYNLVILPRREKRRRVEEPLFPYIRVCWKHVCWGDKDRKSSGSESRLYSYVQLLIRLNAPKMPYIFPSGGFEEIFLTFKV
jgi:hypothetical protein